MKSMKEMKRRWKDVVFITVIALVVFGIHLAISKLEEGREPDWATIYILALDETIPLDDALNHEMEYISIDLSSLPNLDEESADMVLEYFEKYGVEVRDDSIMDLDAQGMVSEYGDLDGILLYVEEVVLISDWRVIISCAKFRSGVGAIGMKVELIKDGDTWGVEYSGSTWIS